MKENDYLNAVHDVSYRLLCSIEDFCKKKDIHYFLHGGTLLGAVRHKDFIPWDDDVDIVMPRASFEKFLRCAGEGLPQGLMLDLPSKRSHYVDFIPRIVDVKHPVNMGDKQYYVAADIFTADPVSKHPGLHLFTLKLIIGLAIGHREEKDYSRFRTLPEKIGGRILPFIGSLIPLNKLVRLYERVQKKEYDGPILFLSNDQPAPKIWGNMYKKEMYDRYATREWIRDRDFPAPFDPDYCLKIMYGDYMKLPPKEKRVPEHFSVADRLRSKL